MIKSVIYIHLGTNISLASAILKSSFKPCDTHFIGKLRLQARQALESQINLTPGGCVEKKMCKLHFRRFTLVIESSAEELMDLGTLCSVLPTRPPPIPYKDFICIQPKMSVIS